MIELNDLKHVHMVGVGGIGLSALARLMAIRGFKVTGSDRVRRVVIDSLEEVGVEVHIGSWPEGLIGADLLVYSKAVPDDDAERVRARELGIAQMSYSELLGLVSRKRKTIAVTGTHGKTTTTAMIAHILRDMDIDPTAIVGSIVRDIGSNLVVGQGDYLVTEACEYKRSFLSLTPYILVITNIDVDHLDYFKDLADIQRAFCELTDRIVDGGVLVYDADDANQVLVVEHLKKTSEKRDISLLAVEREPVTLKLFGSFNQRNAQAALRAVGVVGISDDDARRSLMRFSGTWRRQEHKGETLSGIVVYDDYGHNPTEVQANLRAMREHFPDKKLVAVFQPHLYSRTKAFFDEFVESFSDVDAVVVLPIYAAREENTVGVTSADMVSRMKEYGIEALWAESFDEAKQRVDELLPEGGVVVTQGAGDVHIVGELLIR